jgi:hypothetical protein
MSQTPIGGAGDPASFRNNRGCLGLIGVAVAFFIVIALVANGGEDAGSETAAFVMCQDFVKDQLRSPSTARFPTVREATITSAGSDAYQVRSHVDAQNAFGAEIRTEWLCEIEYVGDDRWRGQAILLE